MVSNDIDPVFSFVFEPRMPVTVQGVATTDYLPNRAFDAFEVRSKLFSVSDRDQAVAFFDKYGPWHYEEDQKPGNGQAVPIKLSQVERNKALFKRALLEAPRARASPRQRRLTRSFGQAFRISTFGNLYVSCSSIASLAARS